MSEEELKTDLDRRELLWFKIHRDWAPPVGADIDKWLGGMREEDERLELLGDPSMECPKCGPAGCKGC